MFDRTSISTPAPVVHIHNETKPHDTADAARLYGELTAKAEKEVSEAIVTRFGADNELSAVVIHNEYDFARDRPMARVLFRLNGTLYDLKLEPDMDHIRECLYQKVAMKLVESIVSKMISKSAGLRG